MPTNLGNLPSDEPLPNGFGGGLQGGADQVVQVNNLTPANTPLRTGSAGGAPAFQCSIVPEYTGYWLVTQSLLCVGLNPVWMRFDWGLLLNTTDLLGWNLHQICTWNHSSVPHQTYECEALWKVQAGVSYTCTAVFLYSSSNNQQYHTYAAYSRMEHSMYAEGQW